MDHSIVLDLVCMVLPTIVHGINCKILVFSPFLKVRIMSMVFNMVDDSSHSVVLIKAAVFFFCNHDLEFLHFTPWAGLFLLIDARTFAC